jgi:hypothetical protein
LTNRPLGHLYSVEASALDFYCCDPRIGTDLVDCRWRHHPEQRGRMTVRSTRCCETCQYGEEQMSGPTLVLIALFLSQAPYRCCHYHLRAYVVCQMLSLTSRSWQKSLGI